MNTTYTKSDLIFKHYAWDTDVRQDVVYAMDTQQLNLLQGYEVLSFSNMFLDMYMPGHTVKELHGVEYVILHYLPSYITTKRDIAAWLAKHLSFVKYAVAKQLYATRL